MVRHKRLISLCVVLLLLPIGGSGYLAVGPGRNYLRAVSLLQRMADGKAEGRLAQLDAYPVDEQATTIQSPEGSIPARLYVPRGVSNAPGMVILHGVHHLGINEPRLIAFSRAMSSSGIIVLTPELKDIADYRVSPAAIRTIGAAARSLGSQLGGAKVGLMGLSFSGGLSLLAAAHPDYADSIGFVVSVGGHDDLARVCDFFASDTIALPDGTTQPFKSHEYGALVLVYSHLEDFFSSADIPAARDSLRLLLWEDEKASRAAAQKLSPAGRASMELLYTHNKQAMTTELTRSIATNRQAMSTVSPHGNLSGIRAHVLLLHGSGDTVIPASETLWLQRELPSSTLRAALVTPLLSHVDVGGSVSIKDKWDMISFIAALLDEADACAHTGKQMAGAFKTNSLSR